MLAVLLMAGEARTIETSPRLHAFEVNIKDNGGRSQTRTVDLLLVRQAL